MWVQPHRDHILVDDKTAVMSEREFNSLKEYSHTNPTGVYPGKMWKLQSQSLHGKQGIWYLCWFGPVDRDDCCYIYRRPIQILDWMPLMGITHDS